MNVFEYIKIYKKVSIIDWQSKGHRFDSDILHFDYQDFTAM
jgi:hypothetical protein